MKYLGRREERLEFILSAREGEALRFVLGRYPSLPPSYHEVARPESAAGLREEQRLLEEALGETQSANRRQLAEFLARNLAPARDDAGPSPSLRLSLTEGEADWLLEVLNDVRLGAWVRLGRPLPDRLPPPQPGQRAQADIAAMEIAGLVQSLVLEALQF